MDLTVSVTLKHHGTFIGTVQAVDRVLELTTDQLLARVTDIYEGAYPGWRCTEEQCASELGYGIKYWGFYHARITLAIIIADCSAGEFNQGSK